MVPFLSNLNENVLPGCRAGELNGPPRTLWSSSEAFDHVIVSPTATVTGSGLYFRSAIDTVTPPALAAGRAGAANISPANPQPTTARRRRAPEWDPSIGGSPRRLGRSTSRRRRRWPAAAG